MQNIYSFPFDTFSRKIIVIFYRQVVDLERRKKNNEKYEICVLEYFLNMQHICNFIVVILVNK